MKIECRYWKVVYRTLELLDDCIVEEEIGEEELLPVWRRSGRCETL